MIDPRFAGSVMLLCHHSNTGAFALCVNHQAHFSFSDISEEIGLETPLNFPMYWGGPVKQGSIWMLHSSEWYIDKTMHVNEEWAVTSHDSMFHHIADGDTPREFRFIHGFTSWGPGQLDGELSGKHPWTPSSSWVVSPDPGPGWLFNHPEETLWENSLHDAGKNAVSDWL